ncbi:hypothetical protein FNJ84_08010 [Paracoccus sp. M683]|nr:hypothetical protein FNJ84_08010 [Paracoccus sp. M683]
MVSRSIAKSSRPATSHGVSRTAPEDQGLGPSIGCRQPTEVALAANRSGRGVVQMVLERGLMSPDDLANLLRPKALTRPTDLLLPARANAVASSAWVRVPADRWGGSALGCRRGHAAMAPAARITRQAVGATATPPPRARCRRPAAADRLAARDRYPACR